MTLTTVTTSLATVAVPLTSGPAHAAPPASRTCQPTFDEVICIKIASAVPAPADLVPQAIDNRLPVR